MTAGTSTIGALRRLAAPLRGTPLHPQWIVARAERRVRTRIRMLGRGTVIDVGCASMDAAADVAPGCRYVGIDYPATAVTLYRTKPHVFADAHALPLADASVQTVMLLNVLEHLRDPERALGEAYRVLADDGLCLIDVPFMYPLHDRPHDFTRWTAHGLQRLIGGCGFEIIELLPNGRPPEAAVLLLNLGLADWLGRSIAARSLMMVPAALSMALVPLANLAGALAAQLLRGDLMPHAYFVVARRRSR